MAEHSDTTKISEEMAEDILRRSATDERETAMAALLHEEKRLRGLVIRNFETGATRSADDHKPDYEGILSPLVMSCYGQYMHEHRFQADGAVRDSDNWQKGIPLTAYIKSLMRHVFQLHSLHRGFPVVDWGTTREVTLEELLCACFFNVHGYLHEVLKKKLQAADGVNR